MEPRDETNELRIEALKAATATLKSQNRGYDERELVAAYRVIFRELNRKSRKKSPVFLIVKAEPTKSSEELPQEVAL